ncbi:MAG: biotin--[acetyl-CoA-carboxylase] ligase [Candidatus Microbacterium colombiense]|nr:MAG: biotin--[acetyl-CoA-carboxylase] ligase [Microbacterium sp.]
MSTEFPRASAIVARLDRVDQSGSTNADLMAHVLDPAGWPHLSVLLTDNQTAGRGRLDRRWVAPAGSALAISVLLRTLPSTSTARGWVPLVAGLAMAEAVEAQLPADRVVGVKWPNDVLVDDRKICGILAQAASDAVIVGAGVNTSMTAEQLPVDTATSFTVCGSDADEDRLVADYLRILDGYLSALTASGDAVASGVHEAVTERCVTLGRRVRVSLSGDQMLEARATGLDEDGRLIVSHDGVETAISAGDVVHVRPA